jgi:hypothetical protein
MFIIICKRKAVDPTIWDGNHTVLTHTISIVTVILIKAIIGVIIVMYITTRNKQQVCKIKSAIR